MEDDFSTGLVTSQTDPRGEETTITYDAALRTDVVTSPTTATQDASYNDSALTSTQTTNWTEGLTSKSATTTYSYDGWGRVKSVVGPNNGQVNTTYDAMGRVWKQTNPFQSGQTPGAETVNTFDALGRTTQVTLPDSQTVQTAYSGNTVTVTDQVNRKMKREADGLGRLVKVYEQTSGGGTPSQETSYTYDLMDRLTEVNQGSQLRKYKYDDMGRLLFEKIPEQSATINDGSGTYWTCKYTYTDYNAVATKTDARGVVTSYSYDDLRRMTGVSYNVAGASGVASTPSVTYSYDTGSTSATKGLLLSVSVYNQSSESYSYDTDNRLSSLTRTIGTRNYATGYTYTTANQVTQLTYPSNRAVNINHDSIGRLSSIVNNSDSANYLSSISYNYAGQTTAWTLGSNIAESFGYDSNRLQMTSQTVTQSGSTRLSLSYSYAASSGQMGGGSTAGNAGQLISVSGSIGGQTESAAYTYDNVGRLVTSNQTSNGVSGQRRFVYDRWGNRTEVYDATSGGSQIQSVSLEQSGGIPTNRIASVTESSTLNYTYDSAGNVTSDGVHSYTYDAENRVVSVDSGSTASYSYDHQNRRVKKTVGSTTMHYVWQGGQVIAEHNGSTGAMVNEYIFAGGRMIAREGGGRVFFLYDRLSARATISDGQGNITGRQSHLPFGEELNATGTTDKHRFTSYERDSETATEYAVNRGYSANVGRFNQADPYQASAYMVDPQSWNRYSYSINDSINRKDPSGLNPFQDPEEQSPNGRTDPCGSFGFSFFIDGFELSREIICIAFFASLLLLEQRKATCESYIAPFQGLLSEDDFAVAEAVFAESSGNRSEDIAIAYVLYNRRWFLSLSTDTHGFGPRNGSIRNILGAPGQFPEYDSNGNLIGSARTRLQNTLSGAPETPDCQRLYEAHAVVYEITRGGIRDPFTDQGGSWYFAQANFTQPGRMCRDCSAGLGPLGPHFFYSIPYQNYTGGQRPPWF